MTSRKTYIDILRILAIFFVIFNHTQTKGFFLFSLTELSFRYWLYLFLSVFCKIAVPLFFMISGALLIPKEETINVLYRKRILKYCIVIIIFSAFYYYLALENKFMFSLKDLFRTIYSSNIIEPYWFLYSYLGLLIMLPLIRKMARNMTNLEFVYMFILHLIFTGGMPILHYLLFNNTIAANLSIPIVTISNIYYVTMGYYIDRYFSEFKLNKLIWLSMIIFSFVAITITCFLVHYAAFETGSYDQTFHSIMVSIPTIFIFCFFKWKFENKSYPKILLRIVSSAGSCTFGIYLLEEYLRSRLLFIYDMVLKFLPPLTACFIYIISVMLCGYFIVLIAKKIPYIKKLF